MAARKHRLRVELTSFLIWIQNYPTHFRYLSRKVSEHEIFEENQIFQLRITSFLEAAYFGRDYEPKCTAIDENAEAGTATPKRVLQRRKRPSQTIM